MKVKQKPRTVSFAGISDMLFVFGGDGELVVNRCRFSLGSGVDRLFKLTKEQTLQLKEFMIQTDTE